jgi:Asp-tRNA(Asn)/Glu-tRNA(Gln) amidotransferase A subunit family amidase
MRSDEICHMSAWELREEFAARTLSPVEVNNAVLARVQRANRKLNAYCTVVAEGAREDARRAERMFQQRNTPGPLHGVPLSIKDLVYTKSIRTTNGSMWYKSFVPEVDVIVVERPKAAGVDRHR